VPAGGWDEETDEILGGDLTAALAYVTPAGGAVATPVAPIGLRDRAQGTVTFTTSQGFGRKLERIKGNPKVALAYHAREHGYSNLPRFVLVQGKATPREPDREALEAIRPNVERHLGPPKTGRLFWDRWLSAYYADRLLVDVEVQRIVSWPTPECKGEATVHGEPLPTQQAPSQAPPAKGKAPRIEVERAAARLRALPHRLVAAVGGDGYPTVLPFELIDTSESGLAIQIAPPGLDAGARRAGLLAHEYRPQLIGLKVRQHTGWLEVAEDRREALYAPHTEGGFAAPPNKTVLLLANGFMARRGLRKAAKEAG
jgi:nitroimidazol reductase NimA-like FMN-containing flavoprotein (pyridoxamine 5'-phosphate oxidase superfamily)